MGIIMAVATTTLRKILVACRRRIYDGNGRGPIAIHYVSLWRLPLDVSRRVILPSIFRGIVAA